MRHLLYANPKEARDSVRGGLSECYVLRAQSPEPAGGCFTGGEDQAWRDCPPAGGRYLFPCET